MERPCAVCGAPVGRNFLVLGRTFVCRRTPCIRAAFLHRGNLAAPT